MSLLDDPIQLVIVGVVVIVFFMYGPKKIPELARALGQARGEFAAGSAKPTGLTGLANAFTSIASPPADPSRPDAQLVDTAARLGIQTEGMTSAQITDAIVSRAKGL